jgi:hypothetical protein
MQAPTGCTWTATSSASWLTVTGGASGSGNGTISYSTSSNNGGASRSATITAGGKIFTLTQSGSCTYTLGRSSTSVAGGGRRVECRDDRATADALVGVERLVVVKILSAESGKRQRLGDIQGHGEQGATTRTGRITAGGQTFTVTQAAPPVAPYSISPASQSAGSGGGTFTHA